MTEVSFMSMTTSELDEMEEMVTVLEGALKELPTLIFILRLSLHQARVQIRTAESAVPTMLAEVEAEAEG